MCAQCHLCTHSLVTYGARIWGLEILATCLSLLVPEPILSGHIVFALAAQSPVSSPFVIDGHFGNQYSGSLLLPSVRPTFRQESVNLGTLSYKW